MFVTFYRLIDGASIGRTYSGSPDMLAANTPAGCASIDGAMDGLSQRVDLNTLQLVDWQPPAPADDAMQTWAWNAGTKRWAATPTLAAVKTACIVALRDHRDAVINNSFTWDGSVFDSDQVSQTRLLGLKVASQEAGYTSKAWRLADNSWRMLSAIDAAAVWDALTAHIESNFLTFAMREGAINAATTTEDAQAVAW